MVCVKVDGTSKGRRHFLGVNVQVIENGEIKVYNLGTVEQFSKQTSSAVKVESTSLLVKFGVDEDNILTFTTDNGANMLRACQLLDEVWREHLAEFGENLLEEDVVLEILLQKGSLHIQSVRCAAHTLQLAIDDAMKKTPSIGPIIDKVRELSKYMRTPTIHLTLRCREKPLPSIDCATRWGSTYDMLKSVHQLRSFIRDDFSASDKKKYDLTSEEWTEVEGLLEALESARIATIALQAKNLLLGDFYAVWCRCLMQLKKLDSELAINLVNAMEERVKSQTYARSNKERLSPLFGYPGFDAALLLDPRYFSLLEEHRIEAAKDYLEEVWLRLEHLRKKPAENEGESDDSTEADNVEDSLVSSVSLESDSEDEFAQYVATKNKETVEKQAEQQRRPARCKIRPLIDRYCAEMKPMSRKSNILNYWEKQKYTHPELYLLAITILAIPATQVTVERLFSALRFILNPRRYKLSHTVIEDVMLLHANAEVLRSLIGDESEAVLDKIREVINQDSETS